jgi:hypothetical protein
MLFQKKANRYPYRAFGRHLELIYIKDIFHNFVKICPKDIPKLSKIVKKLSKSCIKVVKMLFKSCEKVVKIVKNLSKLKWGRVGENSRFKAFGVSIQISLLTSKMSADTDINVGRSLGDTKFPCMSQLASLTHSLSAATEELK